MPQKVTFEVAPLPTIPLYIVNQTDQPMMEVWISYAVQKLEENPKPGKQPKVVLVEQNFYKGDPVLVGPTPIFVGNIEVHENSPPKTSNVSADLRQPNSWKIFWRDEENSLDGRVQDLVAPVIAKDNLVELYVVEHKVKVNQQGTTVADGNWRTLCRGPSTETTVEPPAETTEQEIEKELEKESV